jgi:hypothetical protein
LYSDTGLIVDLITCSLNSEQFVDEIAGLKVSYPNIQINYSVNLTGNPSSGGDWVMESNGENIKDIYFNSGIDQFVSVLAALSMQNFPISIIVGNGQISLSWSKPSGNSNPDNYVIDTSINNIITAKKYTSTLNNILITDLSNGINYQF